MILTLILSEITFRISLYRQRHRERHYAPDFGAHNPYLAETSVAGPGAVGLPEPHVYKRRRGCCSIFWSIVRFCWVWLLCAGILNITIKLFIRQRRSVFVLPFSRDSSPSVGYRAYRDYDPKDLFTCPEGAGSNRLSYLCRFDNVVTVLAAAVGLVLIVEAVATIIFENRDPRPSKSSPSFKDPVATKHRAEPINQEELGNSHVVVVGPEPMELQPYGVYQDQSLQHAIPPPVSPGIAERALPPLPPRSVLEGDDNNEDIYSAKALPDKKQDLSPNVWASAADEKSNMKESLKAMSEEEPIAYETLRVEDENQAGPSRSYPKDVKRP
ncbi:hypothetical protein EC968_000507 [Mortierella alpina]|nr:hypothetical protein EC968_000507 [Mortierella alpina]